MAGRVEGKVAIVTGGASGIGAATVRMLAAEGAAVVASDVDRERGEALAKELGGKVLFARHDVCDEASWVRLISDTEARFGKLDVLVNNAGIIVVATIEDTTLEQWRRIHAVNAEGVFLGCKHAIPAMRRAGGGSIVNVSSLAALRGTPIYAAYSASKGAVRSLTKTVSLHCRQRGEAIRCNSIHPGGVETRLMRAAVKESTGVDMDTNPEAAAAFRRSVELAQPEAIAPLIVYLASDESSFVNGEEIAIDGGLSASYELTPPGDGQSAFRRSGSSGA
jgi:3(or 17)beta-hydroxysteroid dehydrogenase